MGKLSSNRNKCYLKNKVQRKINSVTEALMQVVGKIQNVYFNDTFKLLDKTFRERLQLR